MKKIVLLALSILTICSTSFGQTAPASEQPLHQAFIYAGTNFAPSSLLSYSAEVGTWGQKSNTSFSATFDAIPSYGTSTLKYWVGAKAYWTVHSEDKLCYMIYVAPKVCLDKQQDQLIEFGFNPNYTLTKWLLLGVTIGDQCTATSQWNLFVSGGFVFLLPKANKAHK